MVVPASGQAGRGLPIRREANVPARALDRPLSARVHSHATLTLKSGSLTLDMSRLTFGPRGSSRFGRKMIGSRLREASPGF
ncbi:hypothetical protein CHELA1G11_11809 [Hyphomicrobiales bacterium]|nr:hypothetical protein CHELA1G11_11809 [Hyphomicrobiales bacterium]CAH1665284.1 hypothetical protein CHELA1G2_12499 [Hyphomicrobiales bacterium]